MKRSLGSASLLAFVHLAAAQNACLGLTTLFPDCAFPCVTSAGSAVGCTVATDLACRCDPTTSRLIQNSAVACVIAACTGSGELASALAAGPSICGCVATAVPDITTTTNEPVPTTTETTPSPPSETTTEHPPETTTEPPSNTYENPTDTITSTTIQTEPPSSRCDTESPCQASIDAVPDCAENCLSSAAVTAASCSFGDYGCQCSSTAVIQNAAQGCVISDCGIAGAIQVLSAVGEVCSCVEANPTTPCTEAATHPPSETETEAKPTDTKTGGQSESQTETGSQTESPTTKSDDHTGEPTCTAGTTVECGPVASTAIPVCAQPCFTSAAPSINCGVDDYACQCEADAQASLSQILLPCVLTACDSGDLPGIITGASSVCACATAVPPANECTTTGDATETETTKSHTTKTSYSETQPTVTEPAETTSTCTGGVTQDCGPVATTAVPSCAHSCFSSAAPNVGCGVDDYACQCESEAQASLSQLLIPCVLTACDSGDLTAVITGASSVCACAHAEPTGGCATENPPPGGGDTTTDTEPTTTKKPGDNEGGDTTTCVDATTSDCGPVATSAVPSCAQACFTSAAPGVGCDVHDYVCQCESEAQESLSQLLIPCVATACDSDQLPGVITGASSVCACATAPPSGGNCGGPGGGGGGGGEKPTKTGDTTKPTGGSGGHGDSSTCVPSSITPADCGPVATSAVPSCAHACFSSAAPDVGCGVDDYACQCEEDAQASLSQLLIPCVATACDSGQLAAVIAGASSVCACAQAEPTGGSDCEPGSGGSGGHGGGSGGHGGHGGPGGHGGGNGEGSITTCVSATKTGNNGGVTTSTSCYCVSGGQTITKPFPTPTGKGNDNHNGNGGKGKEGIPGDHGGGKGEESSGNESGSGSGGSSGSGSGGSGESGESSSGSKSESPLETEPAVVVGSGARFEIGLVAGIFGAFWLVAVAL